MKPALTSEARFLRLFFFGALIIGGVLGIGRVLQITRWLTRPHIEATLEAVRTTTSGRSGGGGFACERIYAYQWEGASLRESVDSPCFVWLGPRTASGERVAVSVEEDTGKLPVGATEVFGVGLYETLPVIFLGGYWVLRQRMLKRGAWYAP